jgi:hypothetical protein
MDKSNDWRDTPVGERFANNDVPDRLSIEPSSPWHCPIYIRRINVTLNGRPISRIVEYSVKEGWVRRHQSTTGRIGVSKRGRVVAFKEYGVVAAAFVGILKGRVVNDDKIEAVIVPYENNAEIPVGSIDIDSLVKA